LAIIVLPTEWQDNQVLTASALNGNFDAIVSDYNGNITNANISASADIAWSKVSKAGSSIDDLADVIITTPSSGQVLKYNGSNWVNGTAGAVTYAAFIAGVPSVANDIGINPRVRAAATVTRISAYARTAATGADLIVRVWDITTGATVGSVTVAAGANSGTTTVITNPAISAGDILRYDVTQQGSSVSAANITVQADATE